MSKKDSGVKTPAEVVAQDELENLVTLDFASKEDSKQTDFLPLEENIYKMTVDKAEVRQRPNYNDPSVMENVIMITFSVEGTVSGEPIKDINGNIQEPNSRKFWEFLSTTAKGFRGDGKPSKTRACIFALMGKDLQDEFKGVKTEDLEGKSCKVMLELKDKKDGTLKNSAVKYSIL